MPKPLTLEQIDSIIQVTVPYTVAKAGWMIDEATLSDCVGQMGLIYPVKIRYTSGERRKGCHRMRFRNNEWRHDITVSQLRPAVLANKTLLHELRHAMQLEHYMAKNNNSTKGWKEAKQDANGTHGKSYIENLYEIDARAFADKNAANVKLIVEVGKEAS